MTKLRADTFSQECPSREVLGRLANKWSLLVIDALESGPTRNGALMRRIQGISQKMLTETLRDLESLNLVTRHSRASVPPHVEYELTPLGRSLRRAVCRFDRWIEDNLHDLMPVAATNRPKVSRCPQVETPPNRLRRA